MNLTCFIGVMKNQQFYRFYCFYRLFDIRSWHLVHAPIIKCTCYLVWTLGKHKKTRYHINDLSNKCTFYPIYIKKCTFLMNDCMHVYTDEDPCTSTYLNQAHPIVCSLPTTNRSPEGGVRYSNAPSGERLLHWFLPLFHG